MPGTPNLHHQWGSFILCFGGVLDGLKKRGMRLSPCSVPRDCGNHPGQIFGAIASGFSFFKGLFEITDWSN
jgi:hypothetical protein